VEEAVWGPERLAEGRERSLICVNRPPSAAKGRPRSAALSFPDFSIQIQSLRAMSPIRSVAKSVPRTFMAPVSRRDNIKPGKSTGRIFAAAGAEERRREDTLIQHHLAAASPNLRPPPPPPQTKKKKGPAVIVFGGHDIATRQYFGAAAARFRSGWGRRELHNRPFESVTFCGRTGQLSGAHVRARPRKTPRTSKKKKGAERE